MKRLAFLSLLLTAVTGCSSLVKQPAAEDPKAAVSGFYGEVRELKVSGLPTGKTWKKLEPLVTPELAATIRSAQEKQAASMKAHPDDKPIWIEGDMFSSLFEGPQKFTYGEAKIKGDRAQVPVNLTYSDSGHTTNWTDTFVVVKTERGWLIDDVIYGGKWDFALKGSLSQSLKAGE